VKVRKFIQLSLVAAFAISMAACGGKSGNKSEQSPEEEKAAQELTATGTVFEGAQYTITYPEAWKETYSDEGTVNAAAEDGGITMSATFSDYPCKPSDFEQYYKNFVSMQESVKFDAVAIDGDIMTFKGVEGDNATTNYVVYLDDKAGVAGKVTYPVAKAAEVEPLIKPMLKSIKKK